MSQPPEKKLVRESEWMRVYSVGRRDLRYESKFLTGEVEVRVDSLRGMWEGLAEREKVEFAMAFYVKPKIDEADEKIFDFLIERGPESVWSIIALALIRYPDREKAIHFLMERVEKDQGPRANYYAALELLNDKRAVPVLNRIWSAYRQAGVLIEERSRQADFSHVLDYLHCSGALHKLTGSSEHEIAIKELASHPDERIRQSAERLLSRKGAQPGAP